MRLILRDKVLEAQEKDLKVEWVKKQINSGVSTSFQVLKNDIVAMTKQNYVSNDKVLKE